MHNSVFVLDASGQPLMPCHPARARELLRKKKAVVHRIQPFVIRLTERIGGDTQPLRVKLDPGSKTTGLALVRESEHIAPATGEVSREAHVLMLSELEHRGQQISKAMEARKNMRRRRRSTLRYRAQRSDNRRRSVGWLPPSLQHRVDTTMAWVARIRRWAPVTGISSELVRFDMQQLQNPEISGVEYQQGTLAGYEVREYLLEKWHRECAYCSAKDVPLQIEHIHPKARGGSNRISNLALACRECNQAKGALPVQDFLSQKPDVLRRVLVQAKAPLKDAAAVNATRWALANSLKATGLPVELASGGRTKYNRTHLGIPKTHALDAACVGDTSRVSGWQKPTLRIKCTGRGSYQRTRLNKHGSPRGYLMRKKQAFGFQTGDLVRAVIPKGKHKGVHSGRVAIRAKGSFNIQTGRTVLQGISHRYCTLLQRADGYGYSIQPLDSAHKERNAGEGRLAAPALSLPGLKAEVSRAI